MQRHPPENTSPYSTEVQREFFLYKIRIAQKEIQRNQQILEEYRKHYFCERSPFDQHDFQPYQPFIGCFKKVCRFCFQESAKQHFTQSVNAYKGKRFGAQKKKPKRKTE